jgi:hypothetical protein
MPEHSSHLVDKIVNLFARSPYQNSLFLKDPF